MNEKLKDILTYVIIILVVILIRTFLISPARVNGDSMYDTLSNKDIVFVNKFKGWTNNFKRYDIVVLRYEDDNLIKRIIGLPGEKVEYKDNVLYIDNDKIETPFEFRFTNDFVYEVPYDEYFVMGDNRGVSKDSRYFGSVEEEDLKGTVKFVFFPFKSFGTIKK